MQQETDENQTALKGTNYFKSGEQLRRTKCDTAAYCGTPRNL